MAINITFPRESLKNLNIGIRKVYNIIKTTIGPKGNIVVKDNNNLNTGKEILDAITLVDQFQNVSVQFLSDLVNNIETEVSDGTKTAIIIFSNMFFDLYRLVNKGYSRMKIGKSIDNIKSEVRTHFDTITRNISDPDILGAVIHAHTFNPQLGELITKILFQYDNIGIKVTASEESFAYDLQKGITFDSGILSLQMV